jgi:hypothetical protein
MTRRAGEIELNKKNRFFAIKLHNNKKLFLMMQKLAVQCLKKCCLDDNLAKREGRKSHGNQIKTFTEIKKHPLFAIKLHNNKKL